MAAARELAKITATTSMIAKKRTTTIKGTSIQRGSVRLRERIEPLEALLPGCGAVEIRIPL